MGLLEYLSPTTFIRGLNCTEQIRLLKVTQILPRDQQEQTLPMATGIAFDGMVKCELNKRFKLKEVLAEIRPHNHRAIDVAEALMGHYKMGPLQELKKEGIGYGGIDEQRELTWTDQRGVAWISVCRGKPDLSLTDGTIIDWKVQGTFSAWGAEPKKGYVRCFLNGKDQGPSPISITFMEMIDRDWAIQLYLYARLLGHHPGRPLRGGIEQLAVDKENNVRCVSYRAQIGYDFQLEIERKFHIMYKALNEGTAEPPHYHDKKCIQYKKLCPVASHCDGYKKFQARRAGLSSLPVLQSHEVNSTSEISTGSGSLSFLVKGRLDGVQPNSPLSPPIDSSKSTG